MKQIHSKKFLMVALLCAVTGCSDDHDSAEVVMGELEKCGDGILDNGEICDGTAFRSKDAVCADGSAADKSLITCTDKCALDISKACNHSSVVVDNCGNGKLDAGEVCDGGLFADGVRVCANNQAPLENPIFRCTSKCELDTSQACSKIDNYVLFSEFIPALEETAESIALNGFAFELTNMGTTAVDASDCSFYMVNADASSELTWKLSDYGVTSFNPHDPTVICILNEGKDSFPGACDYTISVQDFLSIYANKTLFALTCGGQFVDMLNLNSVTSAIAGYGVDFIRHCDALPVTEVSKALLGVGWTIDPKSNAAPNYGLGSHCNTDLSLASCTYTADRTTLTDRTQKINLVFDIKIPGLSDKSSKTDESADFKLQFVSGRISSDGKTVSHEIHHRPAVSADKTWTDDNGIDRYISVQHNWDTYEGYWSTEQGKYVLDAGISFDNGETWTYCGPKGVISNIESYDADNRNTLTVSYEAGTCGDGIIDAAEVCDGSSFINEVLVCSDEKMVPVNMSKASCTSSCDSYNVEPACALVPDTCGNSQLDSASGELCDGALFNDEALAAKCKDDSTYISGRASCDQACNANVAASCILKDFDIGISEFIVKLNDSTKKPEAMAFAVRNYNPGFVKVDGNSCSFYIQDNTNKVMNGYTLASLITGSDSGSDTAELGTCDPIVVCSEPYKANEADYIFPASMCDSRIFIPEGNGSYPDLIDKIESIARLQFTCAGTYVDNFDFAGLKSAIAEGYTHGIIVDNHSWADAATAKLSSRMTLDKTYDLSSFASSNCVSINP